MILIGGIYKIISPTNRIYIGQTIDFEKRIYHYSILDCKGQIRLYRSIKKYGWAAHNFSIVEYCEESQYNIRERFWQDKYDVMGKRGLNCTLTQTNYRSGQHSESTRKKISKALTGIKRSEFTKEKIKSRWNSEGYRERIKKTWEEKKLNGFVAEKRSHTEVTKKKMSEIRLKNKSLGMTGKKHSDETKMKMIKAAIEREAKKKQNDKTDKEN